MSQFNKIAWLESQYLYPHHFQQQERYFENLLEQRCKSIDITSYGFNQLLINSDLLSRNKLAISLANGVFPDGCLFNLPADSPLPEALELSDETPPGSIVYLAIPIYQQGSCYINIEQDNNPQLTARYSLTELEVYDYSSANTQLETVETARLQCKLLIGEQDIGNYCYLPLVKILEVNKEHGIVLDQHHVPPLLNTKANDYLQNNLQYCAEVISQRSDSLAARFTAQQQSNAIADFLLLQLLNGLQAELHAHLHLKQIKPFSVFQLLAKATAEMATFCAAGRRPIELISYDHDRPKLAFKALFEQLYHYLNTILEQSAVQFSIKEHEYGIYHAKHDNWQHFKTSKLVVAAKSSMDQQAFKQFFPAHFKIAAIDEINHLVNNHLMGIPLQWLDEVPREIPHQAGFLYYELQIQGHNQIKLQQSEGIGFHIGANMDDLELALWAVKV